MKNITSSSNPDFSRFRSLSTSKGQSKYGEFFLMGERLIEEFLRAPNTYTIRGEVRTESMRRLTSHDQYVLSPALFNELDVIGTHFNLLLLEKPALPPVDWTCAPKGLEVICPAGDPSNLGAIARSALAFGANALILTSESSTPFHPRALKASAGALLKIPLLRAGSVREIPAEPHTVALDMKGTPVDTYPWRKNQRVLLGEEGPGLPEGLDIPRVSIPTRDVESLNVAVAASIALYAYTLKTK